MLFAPMQIVFAYNSSMALLTERRSFLFRIAVAENCVYNLMSFFLSAVLRETVDATHVFERVTALAESDVLLPSLSVVYACVCDVRLLSVLQGSQFDCRQAYLAYHWSQDVD